jgi:hypothetical protein
LLIGQIRGYEFGDDEFGFSITSPFKAVGRGVKKVGKRAVYDVKRVGKAGVKVAKTGVKVAKTSVKMVGKGLKIALVSPALWLASKATAPIRNRVHKLRNRRASKIAWDNRKSKTPNAQEQAQAKSWTKSHLKGKGPHGQILALFAGAPDDVLLGSYEPYAGQLGLDPATATVIAASIPIFMALMNKVLGQASSSGEAPADPQADAAATASAAAETAAAPGEIDVGPAQEAAADAAQAVQEAAQEAGVVPPPAGIVRLPGGVQAKKSHLLIGGAVVGGLVLLTLLMQKKS